MRKYKFTEDMREISGLGGSYEVACRDMLKAGLEWFDNHPEADPEYTEYENITGLIKATGEDSKSLRDAVVESVDAPTGAMVQVVIEHVLWIKKNSWEEWVERMEEE